MFGIGMPELLIILVVVLIIFGGRRLPEIGKGLGQSIREFREVTADASRSEVIDVEKVEEVKDETARPPATTEASSPAASSAAQSIRDEISNAPGVKEVKEIKDKAKKLKKLTSLVTKKGMGPPKIPFLGG